MTKISNQYSLTNILTADLANSRLGINNVSPAYSLDLTGTARVSTSTYLATASGSVGIGTTSPAGSRKLTVAGGIQITTGDNSGASFNIIPGATGQDGADLNLSYYTGTGFGPLTFTLAGSERMRIISTGNILVNTSTNYALGNDNNKGIIINGVNPYTPFLSFRVSDVSKGVIYANINEMLVYAQANIPMIFGTNDTERMRITSDGNLLLNSTNNTTGSKLYINSSESNYGIVYQTGITNNFYVYGSGSGYLRAAAWSYGSDRRMKENISDVANGLELVSKLKPKHFDYIDGVKNNLGFIAQDVQELIPQAVSISDEKTGMLALKTDFIIPYLVKSIQELSAKVSLLENK